MEAPPVHVYHRKKEMSFKEQVIDIINASETKKVSVQHVANSTGLSNNYVRVQLRFMEQAGLIEKVDERLPIIYQLSANNPIVKNMDAIKSAKASLLAPPMDTDHPLVAMLKKIPKKNWHKWPEGLETIANAIKELEAEGKLVETL